MSSASLFPDPLVISGLAKAFGTRRAVDGINLRVRAGEFVADGGSAQVAGHDISREPPTASS